MCPQKHEQGQSLRGFLRRGAPARWHKPSPPPEQAAGLSNPQTTPSVASQTTFTLPNPKCALPMKHCRETTRSYQPHGEYPRGLSPLRMAPTGSPFPWLIPQRKTAQWDAPTSPKPQKKPSQHTHSPMATREARDARSCRQSRGKPRGARGLHSAGAQDSTQIASLNFITLSQFHEFNIVPGLLFV